MTTIAIGSSDGRRSEWRVAEDELEIGEGQEEEAERGEELHRDREGAGAEAAAEKVARIEHRLVAPQFPEDEAGDRRRGRRAEW